MSYTFTGGAAASVEKWLVSVRPSSTTYWFPTQTNTIPLQTGQQFNTTHYWKNCIEN